ncbi:hypothetical protein POTOM_051822 [Populus tomentosa]|uniref:Protein kinase domain-containing protein n=1 Tax=Populus tomentosa TaxID=118781 RepID=A0A8X7Y2C8_POPTO|nr:hypothetical protein POTOM_051822 [Populus tomentosa]
MSRSPQSQSGQSAKKVNSKEERNVRTRKFAEVLEDWELLGIGGFGRVYKELLGIGGFGRVYKGDEGFLVEIVSIGHLRHQNLVPLLGYCRRKGELLFVYDYMPNVIKGVASGLFYLHEEWEQVVVH